MGWLGSLCRTAARRRVSRRQYLLGLAGSLGTAAGVAGCTSRGEIGASTPIAAVQNYFDALDSGDRETANRYAHEDGDYYIEEGGTGALNDVLDAEGVTITDPNQVALETAVRNTLEPGNRDAFGSGAVEQERAGVEAIQEAYGFDDYAYVRHEAAAKTQAGDHNPISEPTVLLFEEDGQWFIWSSPTEPAASADRWLDDA